MKKKDQNAWKYRQFLWRSWAIQASWNYERQMNMGLRHRADFGSDIQSARR